MWVPGGKITTSYKLTASSHLKNRPNQKKNGNSSYSSSNLPVSSIFRCQLPVTFREVYILEPRDRVTTQEHLANEALEASAGVRAKNSWQRSGGILQVYFWRLSSVNPT